MKLDDPIYIDLYKYTKAVSTALGYRDLLTRLHCDRVQALAETIGIGCGLSNKELNTLRIAAYFHDIGKIGIPDRILLKPARLDEAEWDVMKQHSEIGARIIAATEIEGSREASLVIRHHHERHNGTGYPDGLSGDEIPILSRIIAIADSYDAMTVTRSHGSARTHEEIMAIMHEGSGEAHDPELMHVFCRVVESKKFGARQT